MTHGTLRSRLAATPFPRLISASLFGSLFLGVASAQSDASGSVTFSVHPVSAGTLGPAMYQQSLTANWPATMLLSPPNAVLPLSLNTFLPPGTYALKMDMDTAADWEGGTPSLFFGQRGMAGWLDCQVLFNNIVFTETNPAIVGSLHAGDSLAAASPRPAGGTSVPPGLSSPLGLGQRVHTLMQEANSWPYDILNLGTGSGRSEYQAATIAGGLGAEFVGAVSSQTSGRVATFPPVDVSAGAELLQHVIVTVPFGSQMVLQGSIELGAPGSSQRTPLFPNAGWWLFFNVLSGMWFDPPLAQGFEFTMQNGSKFTKILTLPVGIDGDGLFEVIVNGTSLGNFAEGSTVDFTTLVGPGGVASFRLIGIDPTVSSTEVTAFPVQLEFDTPTADFTMVPIVVDEVGTSCSPAGCATCPGFGLEANGDPVLGNAGFSFTMHDTPAGGIGLAFASLGDNQSTPFGCGTLEIDLPNAVNLGFALVGGIGSCGGTATFAMPLPSNPAFYGSFLTAQGAVLCPAGGLALTNGLKFAIGD